jgi:hypothetical protein
LTPVPAQTATSSPSPVLPSPVPTLAPLPSLSVIAPRSVVAPTPFPDEQEIVEAALGAGTGEHWADHLTSGSFTAPGADERLALVGNVGDYNEVRWVVVGQVGGTWRLLGASDWLGSGFDAPPSFYPPPELLDFDDDGQQEVLSHYSKVQGGGTTSASTLYRWNGQALARIWGAPTAVDNRAAEGQDVSQPYREEYQAEWEWVDLDGDGRDEILLREDAAFYLPGEGEDAGEETPSVGQESGGPPSGTRAFRWDGEAFRPYASNGPEGSFAYICSSEGEQSGGPPGGTASGELWLWRNQAAHPLGVEHVREFRWSPDGCYLAWWADFPLGVEHAQLPSVEGRQGAVLGIYNVATGARREFALDGEPSLLRWTPDGRLAYALPGRRLGLLDLESWQQEAGGVTSLAVSSPSGDSIAYLRGGSLYVAASPSLQREGCDPATDEERLLVAAPAGAGGSDLELLPDPAWSGQGDWIACKLANKELAWLGLVASDPSEPVSGFDLLESFGEQAAPELQFAWSPDDAHLAALTHDPRPEERSTVLYLGRILSDEGDPVGLPVWQEVLRWEEVVTGTVGPAWSPAGDRLILGVGGEIWEVTVAGEATVRHRFSFPELEWRALEWAPDGSGFLVGLDSVYAGHLYWFPVREGGDEGEGKLEPVSLLSGRVGAVRWAPWGRDGQTRCSRQPAMVMVEDTGEEPRFHFIGQDGGDVVVPAMGEALYTSFRVGGERVYYDYRYADRSGVTSLVMPDVPEGCRPPLASPDGSRLAWLCDGGPPDLDALIEGEVEIQSRLIVTDGEGRNPREVWGHIEEGPDYRAIRLVSWRADGEAIYLSRPQYGVAWAYFDYNPGVTVLDLNTGQATQIGSLENVHDALVSPDGRWLAESRVAEWPRPGVTVTLRSLVDGAEHFISCTDEAMVAGGFSFSPENTWLTWREWVRDAQTESGGSVLLVRALRVPDGEPFIVHRDVEHAEPQVGGWLGQDEMVLVYPRREDGTGGYSTVLTLPDTGPGFRFSSFIFLGVLGRVP